MFVPLAIPLNDDTVTPGFLGFGVVIALGVALFFLLRSMNRQISRIQAPKEADLKQAEWERANLGRSGEDSKDSKDSKDPGDPVEAGAEPNGQTAD
jgi:hypothetical protein